MKKALFFLGVAICTVMCACGNKNAFVVNGTVDDYKLEGKTVYLVAGDTKDDIVDSAVVKDGKFSFEGEVTEPWIAVVASEVYVTQCIIEPGVITVKADSIGGTPLNDSLFSFLPKMDVSDIEERMTPYLETYYSTKDAAVRAEAERVLDSLDAIGNARVLDACWDFYNNNRGNLLGAMAMQTIARTGTFTYQQFDSIVKAASPIVANHKPVQDKLAQLRCLDQTSVGKHYTDIQGVDGKLSDLIDGKVALVDFYASWCGPCRAEIKDNLVPLWKKYEKKGLVIVGLNVWERGDAEARKAAHEKVMTELGITYPQLVDSTRTATETYGVNSIPQIMLIGSDGTILARDLRGAAIEEAIKEALKK